MRSLLRASPVPVVAVSTSPQRLARSRDEPDLPLEEHLPMRKYLGRAERTRAVRVLGALDLASLPRHQAKLTALALGTKGLTHPSPAVCLHAIPHTLDFCSVHRVAARLKLPLFLSVHDDPGYVLRGRIERSYALRRFGYAWQDATERFVVSDEMGLEMCRRYGDRSYVLVTDGLETIASEPRRRTAGRLWVYFMGAPHLAYGPNFQCLIGALVGLRENGTDARLIVRAGGWPFDLDTNGVPVELRPWASQEDVARDLGNVDVLYTPLPLDPSLATFGRFSLSTKLISYLGSGVPVLLHGPNQSAAATLLRRTDAGFIADSLDPAVLREIFAFSDDRGATVAANALRLARRHFRLEEVRERFWSPITRVYERATIA